MSDPEVLVFLSQIGLDHLGVGLDLAGVPSAILVPKFSTTMRSLMRMTAGMSCSTSTTVTPRETIPRTISTAPAVSSGFRPANGSSSSKTRGFTASAHGNAERPQPSVRQVDCQLVGVGREPERLQDLGGAARRFGFIRARAVSPEQRGQRAGADLQMVGDAHVLESRHLSEDGGFLEGAHEPEVRRAMRMQPRDVAPVEQDASRGRRQKAAISLNSVLLPAPLGR